MASNFRVLIIGGAFGGLTLAMALERAGIDYLLLESKSTFTPATGATIGFQADGGRILDQLGLYDKILATKSAIMSVTWLNGRATRASNKVESYLDHGLGPALLETKLGYQFLFNRRQEMLEILWSGVKHKEKCLTSKRVTRVEEQGEKVVVFCGDEPFEGDVLVGADGVRSIVRSEMWRIGNEHKPGTFSEEEMARLEASIRGLYGYSKRASYSVDRNLSGCFHVPIEPGRGMMSYINPQGDAFWCVFERLDRTYKSHEIPRYTDRDAKEFAARMRDLPYTKNCSFGDFVDNAEYMHLTPLEEVVFKKWQYGRILCIGDSVHKTTPNDGIGANFAIQGAAMAANVIKRCHDGIGVLSEYPGRLQPHAEEAFKNSYDVTRANMYQGRANKILMHTLIKWAPDAVLIWGAKRQAAAIKLDYLPVPERSVRGTMPFNPEGVSDNIWLRMLIAAPFWWLSGSLEQNYTLYAIMLLEAARRINIFTFNAIPNLLLLSMGKWALPFWFWMHFVFSAPLRRYECSTERMTNMTYTQVVVPVMVIGLWAGFEWAAATQLAVGWLLPGTIGTDWLKRPFRDVGLVRATMGAISVVSAIDWRVNGQAWTPITTAALIWMALLYADMFRTGMVQWWEILGICAAAPLLGPNASVGATWTYREELLRTRRNKNAITRTEPTRMNSSAHLNGSINGSAHGKPGANGHAP